LNFAAAFLSPGTNSKIMKISYHSFGKNLRIIDHRSPPEKLKRLVREGKIKKLFKIVQTNKQIYTQNYLGTKKSVWGPKANLEKL